MGAQADYKHIARLAKAEAERQRKKVAKITAAIQCRLAELRQPPRTHRKRVVAFELRQLLRWIRTGKVRVR